MPLYIVREFHNGSPLGEPVAIEAENLPHAKTQTVLRRSLVSDEQHIENEVGELLAQRIKGAWKDPDYRPRQKTGRKPMAKESSAPVFVLRELHNNRLIRSSTIRAKSLRGAKVRAYRFPEKRDSVLILETENGVLLARREAGGWANFPLLRSMIP